MTTSVAMRSNRLSGDPSAHRGPNEFAFRIDHRDAYGESRIAIKRHESFMFAPHRIHTEGDGGTHCRTSVKNSE